jgi:hypothetical protein
LSLCFMFRVTAKEYGVLLKVSTYQSRSHTLDGSRVRIPRNQFGLIWSKSNPWVGPCLGP